MRAAVDDGRVVWITVLEENTQQQQPTLEEVKLWADVFDHPKVPCLQGDEDQSVMRAIGTWASPSAFLVRAKNMKVLASDVVIAPSGILPQIQERL